VRPERHHGWRVVCALNLVNVVTITQPRQVLSGLGGVLFCAIPQLQHCTLASSQHHRPAVTSRGTPVARLSFSRIDLLSRQPSRQSNPVRVFTLYRAVLPAAFSPGSRAGGFGGTAARLIPRFVRDDGIANLS
jgi:hypothetical protein